MEKERPPVFGMMQRGGQVVINLLANTDEASSRAMKMVTACVKSM